jgi:hypothetical protein
LLLEIFIKWKKYKSLKPILQYILLLFVDCELLSFKVDDDLNFHTLPHYLSIWMGVLLSMLKRILDNFQFLLLTDL